MQRRNKFPFFDLVAPCQPAFMRSASEQLQPWRWTCRRNPIADLLRLGTVAPARMGNPTTQVLAAETFCVAAYGSQQELMRVPPIVADAHLRLRPYQARFKFEAPGLKDARALK